MSPEANGSPGLNFPLRGEGAKVRNSALTGRSFRDRGTQKNCTNASKSR